MASQSFTLQVHANSANFENMVRNFGGLKVGYLSRIAEKGRLTLKGMLIGGNGLINLEQYPVSSGGKRTIKASVLVRSSRIKFSSFPVNLFENGRMLRSGKKEAPKKIITGKFRSIAESRLQSWSDYAERIVLQEAMNKA